MSEDKVMTVEEAAESYLDNRFNLSYEKTTFQKLHTDTFKAGAEWQKQQSLNVLSDEELVSAYEEYIKLLVEELDDLVGLAHIHGWKSTRYEKGVELREKISQAKAALQYKPSKY